MERNIGERIKRWRENRSMTQAELAESSGMTQVHIARLEKNQSSPNADTLASIAKALNIPTYLLFGENINEIGITLKYPFSIFG